MSVEFSFSGPLFALFKRLGSSLELAFASRRFVNTTRLGHASNGFKITHFFLFFVLVAVHFEMSSGTGILVLFFIELLLLAASVDGMRQHSVREFQLTQS